MNPVRLSRKICFVVAIIIGFSHNLHSMELQDGNTNLLLTQYQVIDNNFLEIHQKDGVHFILNNFQRNVNCLLADAMGLGKTRQTVAVIANLLEKNHEDPTLTIIPKSLIEAWKKEFNELMPDLKWVQVLNEKGLENIQGDTRVIVSSYSFLSTKTGQALLEKNYQLLVLDEADKIRNSKTQSFQSIESIKALHTLCLTGTPINNKEEDLISLKKILHNSHELSPADYILSRKKDDILNLPPKNIHLTAVPLTEKEEKAYQEVVSKTEQEVTRIQMDTPDHWFAKILKLRSICNGLGTEQSSKSRMVLNILSNGRKTVIFSKFKETLNRLQEILTNHKIQTFMLTGETKNTADVCAVFRDAPHSSVLLVTIDKGYAGLNLQFASQTIFHDLDYNPAKLKQAEDRIYRMGQTSETDIYYLISTFPESQGDKTVDEHIWSILQGKQKLLSSFDNELKAKKTSDEGVNKQIFQKIFRQKQMRESYIKLPLQQELNLNKQEKVLDSDEVTSPRYKKYFIENEYTLVLQSPGRQNTNNQKFDDWNFEGDQSNNLQLNLDSNENFPIQKPSFSTPFNGSYYSNLTTHIPPDQNNTVFFDSGYKKEFNKSKPSINQETNYLNSAFNAEENQPISNQKNNFQDQVSQLSRTNSHRLIKEEEKQESQLIQNHDQDQDSNEFFGKLFDNLNEEMSFQLSKKPQGNFLLDHNERSTNLNNDFLFGDIEQREFGDEDRFNPFE